MDPHTSYYLILKAASEQVKQCHTLQTSDCKLDFFMNKQFLIIFLIKYFSLFSNKSNFVPSEKVFVPFALYDAF